MKKFLTVAVAVVLLQSGWGWVTAEEAVDLVAVSKIREEGLERSEVMDIMFQLTDVSGPRLTGSPGLHRALEWSRGQMEEWGLQNARLEPWGEFGLGWTLKRFEMHMTEPYYSPIIAYPKAWTHGTGGPVSGTPLLVEVEDMEDLEEYKGQLQDKIVLMPLDREPRIGFEADAERRSSEDLEEMVEIEPRANRPDRARYSQWREARRLRNAMAKFFREEGVAAILEPGFRGEHGTLFVTAGGTWRSPEDIGPPSVVVATEHYARILRLLDGEVDVKLEMNVEVEIHDDSASEYNVIAEIPGSDPVLRDEVVMLGAHIDSWHAATGSTDNAAGCAVMMEAVRILQKLGLKPRRTVRIALWTGEEQGLMGSRAYVTENLADRWTLETTPAHEKFSAYYNLDNGTGKIRGVYLQGNAAVADIFKAYLEPFHDMGAQTLTMRNTGGTDHLAFDAVGLPGFQFIQDPIAYRSRTHHTNMDLYDHAIATDLMQASVVVASFVYHTAQRDEKLPRKLMPKPRPRPDQADTR
ncbi:MAG TPA: M20/M25/M40 family metallo-hydrolase [Acidobacteriota bacterium]|nr:M20/M25/M40 family metallo-hydrolase [Acidobacteriota bacterium]